MSCASKQYKTAFQYLNLSNVFEKNISEHTAPGIDLMSKKVFRVSLVQNLNTIQRKIYNNTFKFTAYREKLLLKSRDSFPRLISIPTVRDKIVLKVIHQILTDVFCIQQKLVQTVIKEVKEELNNFDSFLKLDISDFYGSIDHDILQKKLNKKIRKKEFHDLLIKAITTPTVASNSSKISKAIINNKGVPQGLSISNALAHIYMIDFDKKYSNSNDFKYFRYVDDILILCKSKDLYKIKKNIIKDINMLGLKLNVKKEKNGGIQDGFEFLGYKIGLLRNDNIGLSIRESTLLKFENSIAKMFVHYKHSDKISPKEFMFYLNNKITGSISKKVNEDSDKEKKYGWVFFYSQVDDIRVFYHLDWYVNKLINDFNLIENVKDLELKSFVKAYREIIYNRTNTKYIHRPDQLDYDQKKLLLMETFNVRHESLNSDTKIDKLYYSLVYKPIKRNERDVQHLS